MSSQDPAKAKAVLTHVLRDAALPSLNARRPRAQPRTQLPHTRGRRANGARAMPARAQASCEHVESTRSAAAPGSFRLDHNEAGQRAWSPQAREAIRQLDEVSMRFVLERNAKMAHPQPADCNFYPCAPPLQHARGVVSKELCASTTPEAMLHQARGRRSDSAPPQCRRCCCC